MAAASAAYAAPIPLLFPTGVDGGGNALSLGVKDPHYSPFAQISELFIIIMAKKPTA